MVSTWWGGGAPISVVVAGTAGEGGASPATVLGSGIGSPGGSSTLWHDVGIAPSVSSRVVTGGAGSIPPGPPHSDVLESYCAHLWPP